LSDVGEFYYVRIEYPGYRFQLNNEVNGLTMGGVGKDTEIHHVQVSYSFDDSYEWFGGTVWPHHLVAFGGTDDEFDTDFGYSGKVQFGFGLKDLNVWDPTGETNGFESDNDASSTSQDQPFTSCVFSNFTLVGPERTDALVGTLPAGHKFQYSAVLRRSTQKDVHNTVIAGYPWGLSIRDAFTIAGAQSGLLNVRNTSITASLKPGTSTSVHDEGRWAGVTGWFDTIGWGNLGSQPRNPSTVGFTDMSNLNAPNPVPDSSLSMELIGSADFTHADLAGLTTVTYRGAFDPALDMSQQWTAGWTNFDPQNTDYNPCIAAVEGGVPGAALFSRSFPNPFNPTTTIAFTAPQAGPAAVRVYDAGGSLVRTLLQENLVAGAQRSVTWNGTTGSGEPCASGVYFYRVETGGASETGKMVLVK
jgi:hypothetical protein